MKVTIGSRIDIILDLLAGDLLDETWRCIAVGGTMVEIDLNGLSMEPFGRNASFRALDMSHTSMRDTKIVRYDPLSGCEGGHALIV